VSRSEHAVADAAQGADDPDRADAVNRYALGLLRRIEEGQIDPSYIIIIHRAKLQDRSGRDKKDGCIKVVMTPSSLRFVVRAGRVFPSRF
jgi:hypothetical protein